MNFETKDVSLKVVGRETYRNGTLEYYLRCRLGSEETGRVFKIPVSGDEYARVRNGQTIERKLYSSDGRKWYLSKDDAEFSEDILD